MLGEALVTAVVFLSVVDTVAFVHGTPAVAAKTDMGQDKLVVEKVGGGEAEKELRHKPPSVFSLQFHLREEQPEAGVFELVGAEQVVVETLVEWGVYGDDGCVVGMLDMHKRYGFVCKVRNLV